MQKKYKIGLIIIVILLILVSGLGLSSLLFNKDEEEKNKNTTNIISNIDLYGYTLDDRDTKYMQDIFEELESILNNEEIDEEAYAQCLAKLFIIDFYTLNNKINKYDVGSLEYILSDKVEMFKTKAMDTIYADVIDNTYKDRVQELPEITNVDILTTENTSITLYDTDTESYKITMKYTYKEDLGYDKEGTIYLIKNNNKLEVAVYEPVIEQTTKNE